VKLEELTSELLAQAIGIYLQRAYPDGPAPEVVRGRAEIPPGLRGAALFADERYERVPPKTAVEQATRFNLRLGNAMYPNMKLGVDRVGGSAEFVLVVDTHDKLFASVIQESEREKYRALLDHNRRLQEEIQRAWSAAGLPTFELYLRAQMAGLARGQAEGRK